MHILFYTIFKMNMWPLVLFNLKNQLNNSSLCGVLTNLLKYNMFICLSTRPLKAKGNKAVLFNIGKRSTHFNFNKQVWQLTSILPKSKINNKGVYKQALIAQYLIRRNYALTYIFKTVRLSVWSHNNTWDPTPLLQQRLVN